MLNENRKLKKLIYYDAKGRRQEHRLPLALFQVILNVFDGHLKSIDRTSGGLGLALPIGIKFKVHTDEKNAPLRTAADVLVRMNCKDFDPASFQAEECSLSRPKLVSLSSIHPGFDLVVNDNQRFAVDLGRGLIPIHVLMFIQNPGKKRMAVFIDPIQGQTITEGAELETGMQIYLIPEETLRFARKPNGTVGDELELAHRNFKRLIGQGGAVFPAFLKIGPALLRANGVNFASLHKHLKKILKFTQAGVTQTATLRVNDSELFSLNSPVR